MNNSKGQPKRSFIIIIFFIFLFSISGCAKIRYEPSKIEKPIGDTIEEKRPLLILLPPIIIPEIAKPGDSVIIEFQYSLDDVDKEKFFSISENIILANDIGVLQLKRINHEKKVGTYYSKTRFILPKNLQAGDYKIIVTIDVGEQKKSETVILRIAQ